MYNVCLVYYLHFTHFNQRRIWSETDYSKVQNILIDADNWILIYKINKIHQSASPLQFSIMAAKSYLDIYFVLW